MFTIEMDHDEITITLLDDTGGYADVIINSFDDIVYIRQFEEEDDAPVDVHLAEVGDKKVDVIKAVRAITGLGLKDAKGLVDTAPSVIKEGVVKAEAEEYLKQLEDAGAKAELK